jgi:hypothetical protein
MTLERALEQIGEFIDAHIEHNLIGIEDQLRAQGVSDAEIKKQLEGAAALMAHSRVECLQLARDVILRGPAATLAVN